MHSLLWTVASIPPATSSLGCGTTWPSTPTSRPDWQRRWGSVWAEIPESTWWSMLSRQPRELWWYWEFLYVPLVVQPPCIASLLLDLNFPAQVHASGAGRDTPSQHTGSVGRESVRERPHGGWLLHSSWYTHHPCPGSISGERDQLGRCGEVSKEWGEERTPIWFLDIWIAGTGGAGSRYWWWCHCAGLHI